ncbi:MAG: sigma-54-dependent Fis family transcriptional regulator, partial [Nitrospinota bacterium]
MSRADILVVDDEESIRWIFARSLPKRGYRVTVAATGQEALLQIQNHPFSLIILDIRLPDLDGLTLLEKCRTLCPQVPVLVMTAQNTVTNAINAMKKGAYDYVVKPFDLSAIYTLIEKALCAHPSAPPTALLPQVEDFSASGIIGQSEKMRQIYK